MQTKITPVLPEEAAIIKSLAYKIWPGAYGEILSPGQIKYMLDTFYSVEAILNQMNELNYRFLLISDNEPRGFAAYNREAEDVHKLQKLYIDQNVQGKGYGKLLIEEVIKIAGVENSKQLILNVNRLNKARYFYEKLGFKIIKEVDIPIGEGFFMEDYIMRLELGVSF